MKTIGRPAWLTRDLLWFLLPAAALAVMAGMGGCRMDELVTMRVPQAVADGLGLADQTVTLREGRRLYDEWKAGVARDAKEFAESIEDATFWAEFGSALVNTGIEIGGVHLAAVPGGAGLVGVLGVLAGIYGGSKPKDKKTIAEMEQIIRDLHEQIVQAENRGYDMGREETVKTVREVKA